MYTSIVISSAVCQMS